MLKIARDILLATFNGFLDNRLMSMAAGIAFYAIFSLAPILIVALAFAEPLLGRLQAEESILAQLREAFGADTVAMLRRALARELFVGESWWARAFGAGALLYAGTAIFVELDSALGVIWRDRDTPAQGLLAELRSRLLALLFMAVVGVVLLAAILAGLAISAYGSALEHFPLIGAWFGPALSDIWTLAITATFFTLVYRFLTGKRLAWLFSVIPGAAVALLLWLGNSAIAWYFSYSKIGSAFGAASALAGIMVWIYYSAVIVLLAAQISRATHDVFLRQRAAKSLEDGKRGAG